jgi:hypothetical protein
MDYNGYNLYSSEGTTNNPRPLYPSLLDARTGYARNRFPAALPVPDQGHDLNLSQDNEIALKNTNEPVGTNTFNAHGYIHVAPGYASEYISPNLHFGCHSDSQTHGDDTLIPPGFVLGGGNIPWIPEPQTEIMPESTAMPFNIPNSNQVDPMALLSSQQSLNGTTMVQSSTNLWYPEQLSVQGSETVLGEYNDDQAMDYCYDGPNSIDLELAIEEDSWQCELFSQPMSNGGNMSQAVTPFPNYNLPRSASPSAGIPDVVSRVGINHMAPKPRVKDGPREISSERRCVRCKLIKKRVSPQSTAVLCHWVTNKSAFSAKAMRILALVATKSQIAVLK